MVFFKQLSCWMIYGTLEDRYNEFFISHAESNTVPSAVADQSANDDLDVSSFAGTHLERIVVCTVSLITFFIH